MELQEAITTRRSIRAFQTKAIPREDLEAIVDAGRMAPTGSNRQPWDFLVVTEQEKIAEISKAAEWMGEAAAIVAIVLDEFSPVWKEDGCAAATTMLLKIVDLGYGATWVQGNIEPFEDEFKALLDVPADRHMPIMLPIGVPDELPIQEKMALDKVIHWETW